MGSTQQVGHDDRLQMLESVILVRGFVQLGESFLPDGEKTHRVDVLEVLLHAGRLQVGMRKGIR